MTYSHSLEPRPEQSREQIGCMKLCASVHITPESRQGLRLIVPLCSDPGPCFCLGSGSSQCEQTIARLTGNLFTYRLSCITDTDIDCEIDNESHSQSVHKRK